MLLKEPTLNKWKDICVHRWENLIMLRWQQPQTDPQIQQNLSQSPDYLFGRDWQPDSVIQMELQGPQNSQNNPESEKVGGLTSLISKLTAKLQ